MKKLALVAALLAAGAAAAHQGVKNPVVQARMHGMKEMGAAAKVLGEMAKGAVPFDAATAATALDQIRSEAARVETLFNAPEDDPKSEALPAIWDNPEDFRAKSQALVAATGDGIETLEDLREILPRIGAACSACHKAYRK